MLKLTLHYGVIDLTCRGRRGTLEVGPLGWSVVMFGWSCLSLGGLLSVQSCPWVGGRSLRSRRRLLLLEPSVERLSPATGRRHRIPGHRDVLCILWTCLMERSTIVRNLVNPVVIFIQLSSRWTFACVGCDYQKLSLGASQPLACLPSTLFPSFC